MRMDVTNIPRVLQWAALWRTDAPVLLDAFCGAGGAAVGYWRVGFNVIGVDHKPQPRYPFPFVQGDALEAIRRLGPHVDAIHASPPCQRYSEMTPMSYRDNHPDLIGAVRAQLRAVGQPYVIENVSGARHELRNPMKLCGTMVGLPIWRHRYFEIWPQLLILTPPCQHDRRPVLITDHGGPNANGPGKPRRRTPVHAKRRAMQMWWTTEAELSEAIPPAYTEYIGQHLMRVVRTQVQEAAA